MLKASSWGCCRRPACQPSNTASLTKAAARARRWASCECVSPRARPRPACQRRTKSSQPSAARSKSSSVCFCRSRSQREKIGNRDFEISTAGRRRRGSKWAICAHLAGCANHTGTCRPTPAAPEWALIGQAPRQVAVNAPRRPAAGRCVQVPWRAECSGRRRRWRAPTAGRCVQVPWRRVQAAVERAGSVSSGASEGAAGRPRRPGCGQLLPPHPSRRTEVLFECGVDGSCPKRHDPQHRLSLCGKSIISCAEGDIAL